MKSGMPPGEALCSSERGARRLPAPDVIARRPEAGLRIRVRDRIGASYLLRAKSVTVCTMPRDFEDQPS